MTDDDSYLIRRIATVLHYQRCSSPSCTRADFSMYEDDAEEILGIVREEGGL